ncbi:MAG: hypothetical protein JKY50_02775 [Oleispira sp.]|nr:hypothetical protein [Oleispira sp.]
MKHKYIALSAILLITACGGESSDSEDPSINKTTVINFSDGSSINIIDIPTTNPDNLKSISYKALLSIDSGTKVTGFTQDENENHEIKLNYTDGFSGRDGVILENKKGADFRISSQSDNNFQFLKTVKSGTLLDHNPTYRLNSETSRFEKPTHSDFTIINAAEVGEYSLSLININRGSLKLLSSQHLLKYSSNESSSSCIPKVTFSNDTLEEAISAETFIINRHHMTDSLDKFHVFDFDDLTVKPFNASTGFSLMNANADGVIFNVSDQENVLTEADPSQDMPPQDYNITYNKTYSCEWDESGVIDSEPFVQGLKCSVSTDYIMVKKLYTRDGSGDVTEYIPAGTSTHTCTAETEKNRNFKIAF